MTNPIVTAADVEANKQAAREALAAYRAQQAQAAPKPAQVIGRTKRQRRIFAASNAQILAGEGK